MQFQFIVSGNGNKMPVYNNGNDTVNYIRISLSPDNGRKGSTTMFGGTTWEGKVKFGDAIKLNTHFTLLKTPYTYFTLDGGYREFDWAVDILIGFYYKDSNGHLIGYFGNTDPSAPYNNATYANLYINTKTGDTYLRIHALKNNYAVKYIIGM